MSIQDENQNKEIRRNSFLPLIKKWRTFRNDDLPKVESLLTTTTYELFGKFSLNEMIETSFITIVMENEDDDLIACICCNNYPNIPSLLPMVWRDWIIYHYKILTINYENTLFIHLLCWNPKYNHEFVEPIFKSLFMNFVKLEYICLVAPPSTQIYIGDKMLKRYFYRVLPVKQRDINKTQTLYICSRNNIVSKLKIRHAVAEDNDDLVEILDSTCKKLKEKFGEYFIAEIILNNKSPRKIVVAEHQNLAVGLVCVNSEVGGIKLLHQNFELGPFHGLRKHSIDELDTQSAITVQTVIDVDIKQIDNNFIIDNIIINNTSHEVIDDDDDQQQMQMDEKLSQSNGSNYSESSSFYENFQALVESSETAFSSEEFQDIEDYALILMSRATLKKKRNLLPIPSPVHITKQYKTETNVFTIELYGLRNDFDDRLAYDLLEAAFETFSDREYCLISIPTVLRSFPLLKHFVKVIPRSESSFEQDVHVLHRNSLLCSMTVRIATQDDIDKIHEFINNIPNNNNKNIREEILKSINSFYYSNYRKTFPFIILIETDIVGLCVIEIYKHTDFLRINYDLESYVNYKINSKSEKHCQIIQLILSPLCRPRINFIFLEIIRQTGFTCFYYFITEKLRNEENIYNNSAISDMYPIRPRKPLHYNTEKLNENKPAEYVTREEPLFSLYHTNIRMLSNPKTLVNTRIVIIGASNVGLSFLESLIFERSSESIWFSNITLVNPYSLDILTEDHGDLEILFPLYSKYNWKYIKKLGLSTWTNFVQGFMTQIDRKNKYVVLDDTRRLKYDQLYLFCGLQYNIPGLIKQTDDNNIPSNIILINNYVDAEFFSIKLNIILTKMFNYTIVVYGNSINAYCCLTYLLYKNVSGTSIIFVQPPYVDEFLITPFNDVYVENKIEEEINKNNIKYYKNYKFCSCDIDNYNLIRKLYFESNSKILQLECQLFICYDKKSCNMKTLKSFNRSNLVFDGRLVIDNEYKTNDNNIYGAGTLTKYKRILYADSYKQEYYNSIEIGECLAKKLIMKLNPNLSYDNININNKKENNVPRFIKPIIFNCILPGKLNYLYVRSPGVQKSQKASHKLVNYGVDLVTSDDPQIIIKENIEDKLIEQNTFLTNEKNVEVKESKTINLIDVEEPKEIFNGIHDCKKKKGYFRIHLNQYHTVATIVCLTKKKISLNLINIWGKHEKLLNNILIRYESNIINDFYDFFNNTWCYAIFHDRFKLLQDFNKMTIEKKLNDDDYLKNIIDQIRNNDWTRSSEDQRILLMENFSCSTKYQNLIQTNLLKFLNDNKEMLSMYLMLPDDLTKYLLNYK